LYRTTPERATIQTMQTKTTNNRLAEYKIDMLFQMQKKGKIITNCVSNYVEACDNRFRKDDG
jgi:hypothetical protein